MIKKYDNNLNLFFMNYNLLLIINMPIKCLLN